MKLQKFKLFFFPQIVESVIVQYIFFHKINVELQKCMVNTMVGCDFIQL